MCRALFALHSFNSKVSWARCAANGVLLSRGGAFSLSPMVDMPLSVLPGVKLLLTIRFLLDLNHCTGRRDLLEKAGCGDRAVRV